MWCRPSVVTVIISLGPCSSPQIADIHPHLQLRGSRLYRLPKVHQPGGEGKQENKTEKQNAYCTINYDALSVWVNT